MVSKQLQKSTNYPTEVFSDMDLKYLDTLDELHYRLFIATRADSLGKHGVSLVSNAIHVDRKTVYRGLHDLKCCNIPEDGRVRKVGGGPKRVLNEHPEYLDIFDELVESHTAGLPQDDTVRWLDLNVSQIQDKFKDRSISVSEYIVRQMLKQRNYKRRSCKKAKTLKEVEDRDAQFKKIKSITHECEMLDIPVLSMDTKKKEMIGNFKRDGKAYCLSAPETYDHDFNTFARGMIAPHALYDRRYNIGYMTIGISHDTSEFVCDNIERIWERQLQHIYTNTDTICLLCDGGGSNSSSHHIFKQSLMDLAQRIQMNILVCHYPPYCSKWNPIEHKLFAHISRSWSGVPLLSVEQARSKAQETTTSKGLVVYAEINDKQYKTKLPIKDSYEQLKSKFIVFDDQLPKWNYLVKYQS